MKIIAKKNFSANGKDYIIGDEIKTNNYDAIVKLNEKGFINFLSFEDLVLIKRELENKEENNGSKI